ncbi:MAG: lipoprotein [Verrucomicrobiales bacterium]|nr:lipoprotein [Verrucomicrobiales bacterium]
MKKLLLPLLPLILLLPLGGCSHALVRVKPYERGNLAKPVMLESMDPLQTAMTEHAYFSREAGFGGGGVGGGGCGCN